MLYVMTILLLLCSDSFGLVDCQHFWKNGTALVRSNKVVGVDVGSSAYKGEGTYVCRLNFSDEDVRLGKYVYIGEVGDASYVELKKGPSGLLKSSFPIFHGLSPAPNIVPRYLRFLPFFFPVREIYQSNGIHEIWIHYKDILPQQTGIRSGSPSIESLDGVLRRAFVNGPAFTFHFLQAIVYFILAIGSWFWIGVTPRRRATYSLLWISAALITISITGIPRYFFVRQPLLSLRFNDTVNIVGFYLYLIPLSFFIQLRKKIFTKMLIGLGALSLSSVTLLSNLSLYSNLYLPVYFGNLFVTAAVIPIILGLKILNEKIFLVFSSRPNKKIGFILIVVGGAMAWDCIGNVLLFGMRFPFAVHYTFFPLISALVIYCQLILNESESEFIKKLSSIKQFSFESLASDKDSNTSLNKLSEEFANLADAKRVSIIEVSNEQGRFLGFYGNYQFKSTLEQITFSEVTKNCIKTKKIILGKSTILTETNSKQKTTEYCIVPLEQHGSVVALICLTDFANGIMATFIKNRLFYFQLEAAFLTALFISEKQSRNRERLLEIARLRVHPAQAKSEQYFLENFSLSEKVNRPTIIIGDLAGSVRIQNLYGGQSVADVIDEYLDSIWDRFKNEGIIASRKDGDFVSFIFPNFYSENDGNGAIRRACRVANYLIGANEILLTILSKNNITVPFRFRMVLTSAQTVNLAERGRGFRGLSLISSESINLAARVLSNIPLSGELILIGGETAKIMEEFAPVFPLNPYRLKGFSTAPDLFSALTRQGEKAA